MGSLDGLSGDSLAIMSKSEFSSLNSGYTGSYFSPQGREAEK